MSLEGSIRRLGPVWVEDWRNLDVAYGPQVCVLPADVLAALSGEQRDVLAVALNAALMEVDDECQGKPWLLVREARQVIDRLCNSKAKEATDAR